MDKYELPAITAQPKTGEESISFLGENTKYNLLDFWRWSVSDLISNASRGRFAEFVVGSAIDLEPSDLRDEWDAYDLTSKEGCKIEVKSAAYIQSWKQNKYSTISFSIKRSKLWNEESTKREGKLMRHADVYVFCLLKNKDQETIDPLKMEQWEFYVVPTIVLDNYPRSEHSISLKSLGKLTDPIDYSTLKMRIEMAHKKQLRMKQIKDIFTVKPDQWGLRGDPYLWEELCVAVSEMENTSEPIDFEPFLKSSFDSIIATGEKTSDDVVFFENYEQGGISGGRVSLPWWKKTGLPLLVERYRSL